MDNHPILAKMMLELRDTTRLLDINTWFLSADESEIKIYQSWIHETNKQTHLYSVPYTNGAGHFNNHERHSISQKTKYPGHRILLQPQFMAKRVRIRAIVTDDSIVGCAACVAYA